MISNNTFLKKILYSAGAVLLASVAVSCDNIAEDDRYIIINPVEPERTVLIEDFTGQKCINCPEAHEIIEGLQNQYGDAVIAVSIHAGAFSMPVSGTNFDRNRICLGTPEGTYYNTLFNINSWPQGLINRDGKVYSPDEWATVVRTELQRPSDLAISVSAVLNESAETPVIDIDLELLPQADIEGYLQVWVLESGIVASQSLMGGATDPEYVHNNVFRAAVNDPDGDPVSLTQGYHSTASYSIEVRNNDKERWNPENLSIVAFVRDASGVHQAAKVPVVTASPNP